jgi:hypothetical protein
MTQFIIAYNPRKNADRISGDWELVEAGDKFEALDKLLNMPNGQPFNIFDQSDYIYILEVKPEDKTDLKKR